MKTLGIIISLIIALNINCLYAQEANFSQINEIKKQLGESEKKDLEKAEKLINDGDNIMESAQKKMNTVANLEDLASKQKKRRKKRKLLKQAKKTKEKALKEKKSASTKYSFANKLVYMVYKENLEELGKKSNKDKRSEVEDMMKEAERLYKDARKKRGEATRKKDIEESYNLLAKADQLENDAISMQIQAYSIYLGWFDQEEEEKTLVENKKPEKTNKKESENKTENKKENTRTFDKFQERVIFKVQIAASKVPLSIKKLRAIYPSTEIINNEKDGEWYKYSVGSYKSYEEAYQAKKRMGVKGAFIVAYKDGKKVQDITTVCNPADHPAIHVHSNSKRKTYSTVGLEYRIQIAVSEKKLTGAELSKFNKTSLPIKEFKAIKWYKYTIGSFKTEKEADNYRKSKGYNNSNSVIVKYKNQKEII